MKGNDFSQAERGKFYRSDARFHIRGDLVPENLPTSERENRKMAIIEAKVMDPTHLELSSPLDLSRGQTVFVTVAASEKSGDERNEWLAGMALSLERAYGGDEPDYTTDMVMAENPDHLG